MSVVYIVFPLALLIAAVAVLAFIWATRSGQFDDVDTPAMRMLHDDERTAVDHERRKHPRGDTDRPRPRRN